MTSFTERMQYRLQLLRNAYGLPVFEAEWVCSVSRSSINFWERGKRIPSADGILQIASAYGVSTDWIYGISNTVYTPDSVNYSEGIYFVQRSLLLNVLNNVMGNSDFANKLFFKYGKDIPNLSLQARADTVVCCLYLHGYETYFSSNPKLAPTLQQKDRKTTFKEGLLQVINTKEPISKIVF